MGEDGYWTSLRLRRVGRRKLLAGAAAGGAALGLAACGGGGETGPTATARSQAAAKAKRGGTFTPAGGISGSWPPGLDPRVTADTRTQNVCCFVYSQLWKNQLGADLSPWNWVLEPDLALSVEHADPLTHIYKLRPNVKWQDVPPVSGRALTSQDVAWSLDSYINSSKAVSGLVLKPLVKKIEAVDGQTIRILTNEPTATLDAQLVRGWFFILPHEVEDADGDFKKRAIGSGPFILDKQTEPVAFEFKRNPTYYDPERPYVDAVKLPTLSDSARIQSGMLTGDIDLWNGSDQQSTKTLTAQKKDIQPFIYPAAPFNMIFRSDKAPFNDVRVRQALVLTLDLEALAKRFGGEKGAVDTFISQQWTQWALPRDQWGEGAKYHSKPDIAEAKKLLAAAGHPNGVQGDIVWNAAYQTLTHGQVSPVLQEMAKQAGIDLRINPVDPAIWGGILAGTSDYNGVVLVGHVRYADPDFEWGDWLRANGPRGAARTNDPRINQLVDQERQEMNTEKRKQMFWELEKYNLVQNYITPLFSTTGYDLGQAWLRNYSSRPDTEMFYAQAVWLDK